MDTGILLEGRILRIRLSKQAEQALKRRSTPLLAEMELYFSCLIRKKVRFLEAGEGLEVSDKLRVSFRPVMTRVCGTDYVGEEPPLTDFPLQDRGRFLPRWLNIDYRNGQWRGEFGYEREPLKIA